MHFFVVTNRNSRSTSRFINEEWACFNIIPYKLYSSTQRSLQFCNKKSEVKNADRLSSELGFSTCIPSWISKFSVVTYCENHTWCGRLSRVKWIYWLVGRINGIWLRTIHGLIVGRRCCWHLSRIEGRLHILLMFGVFSHLVSKENT